MVGEVLERGVVDDRGEVVLMDGDVLLGLPVSRGGRAATVVVMWGEGLGQCCQIMNKVHRFMNFSLLVELHYEHCSIFL